MKDLFLKLIRGLPIGPQRQEALLFFLKLGYWPNFGSPVTFNEKINSRKLNSTDNLLVKCTDKVAVRDYVAQKIGDEFLIPVLFSGDSITADQLHALGDGIVAKPSHDSKSAEIIRVNTPELATQVTSRLAAKLAVDYGKTTNQFAYSLVTPRIQVEKMLVQGNKPIPDDYKIFCFRQPDGSTRMYIELHENRELPDYKVTWFDENLEPFPLKGKIYEARPFPCPEIWPRMRKITEALSADFDHVRIDLYYVEEQIYFGEMTFFDGGGRTEYSRKGGQRRHDLDREMGRLWSNGKELPISCATRAGCIQNDRSLQARLK